MFQSHAMNYFPMIFFLFFLVLFIRPVHLNVDAYCFENRFLTKCHRETNQLSIMDGAQSPAVREDGENYTWGTDEKYRSAKCTSYHQIRQDNTLFTYRDRLLSFLTSWTPQIAGSRDTKRGTGIETIDE